MKINRQKINWLVDAVVLLLLLATYEMDLTGLALHQWLGVGFGLLSLFHLAFHWRWVKAVSLNYSVSCSEKTRLCYVVDYGLLLLILLIITSGLLISTWLNIPFQDYFLWRDLHLTFSVLGLMLVAFKLMLHWRWILAVSRQKLLVGKTILQAEKQQAAPAIGRADFLKMLGVVSAATGLVIFSFLHEESAIDEAQAAIRFPQDLPVEGQYTAALEVESEQIMPATPTAEEAIEAAPTDVQSNSEAAAALPQSITGQLPQDAETNPSVGQDVVEAGVEAIPTATPYMPSTVERQAAACIILCRKNRHCAYPGRCREYVDLDQNGLCDLGECA